MYIFSLKKFQHLFFMELILLLFHLMALLVSFSSSSSISGTSFFCLPSSPCRINLFLMGRRSPSVDSVFESQTSVSARNLLHAKKSKYVEKTILIILLICWSDLVIYFCFFSLNVYVVNV